MASSGVIRTTPCPTSAFCTRPIAFSLPGISRAENITVSPASSVMCGWLSPAMRDRADRASPWLPVQISTILSRGM